MQIFIKGLTRKTHTLDVKPSDSVEKIRELIKSKIGFPKCGCKSSLISAGKILEDGRTLKDYNIQKESTLYCTLKIGQACEKCTDKAKYTVLREIKMYTGKTIVLAVEPNDSIKKIKKAIIKSKEGYPQCMRLVFASKQLEDVRTLADYGIQRESTLYVFIQYGHYKCTDEAECSKLQIPNKAKIVTDIVVYTYQMKEKFFKSLKIDEIIKDLQPESDKYNCSICYLMIDSNSIECKQCDEFYHKECIDKLSIKRCPVCQQGHRFYQTRNYKKLNKHIKDQVSKVQLKCLCDQSFTQQNLLQHIKNQCQSWQGYSKKVDCVLNCGQKLKVNFGSNNLRLHIPQPNWAQFKKRINNKNRCPNMLIQCGLCNFKCKVGEIDIQNEHIKICSKRLWKCPTCNVIVNYKKLKKNHQSCNILKVQEYEKEISKLKTELNEKILKLKAQHEKNTSELNDKIKTLKDILSK